MFLLYYLACNIGLVSDCLEYYLCADFEIWLFACDCLFFYISVTQSSYLWTVSVAFKLSKRKPDDNLHMLHTLLFGKKGKVMYLILFVLFLSLKAAQTL